MSIVNTLQFIDSPLVTEFAYLKIVNELNRQGVFASGTSGPVSSWIVSTFVRCAIMMHYFSKFSPRGNIDDFKTRYNHNYNVFEKLFLELERLHSPSVTTLITFPRKCNHKEHKNINHSIWCQNLWTEPQCFGISNAKYRHILLYDKQKYIKSCHFNFHSVVTNQLILSTRDNYISANSPDTMSKFNGIVFDVISEYSREFCDKLKYYVLQQRHDIIEKKNFVPDKVMIDVLKLANNVTTANGYDNLMMWLAVLYDAFFIRISPSAVEQLQENMNDTLKHFWAEAVQKLNVIGRNYLESKNSGKSMGHDSIFRTFSRIIIEY